MATSDDNTKHSNRYRLGLPEWLHQQVDSGLHKNVFWIDKKEQVFQIPWKHASMNCWENKDASLFKAWAVYTNRYREGVDEPKHKQWKSNFRCAINSHNRVFFVKEQDRGNVANRRIIRIAGVVGAEKKYKSRVPKRKLYKSSRSSKAKSDTSDDRVLNSVETVENCARLLLSLKRSSSSSSSSSASSSKSLDVGNNYDTNSNGSREKMGEMIKKGDDIKECDTTRIKKESIDNSEMNKVNSIQNQCVPLESFPGPFEDDQKKNATKLMKMEIDHPCSEQTSFNSSERGTKHSSSRFEGYCYSISTECVTQQQTSDYGDISSKDFTAPQSPTNIPKCSIPTTVIVTMKSNSNWQADPDNKGSGNDDSRAHTIEKMIKCNDHDEIEEDDDNDDIEYDGDNYDDAEDLIMPRSYHGANEI